MEKCFNLMYYKIVDKILIQNQKEIKYEKICLHSLPL